ncbi:YccS/YhfK family integral membrane protein [Klebsiella pneumoniae]|uniref:YccS/YhfK family integral membrane protein n=1 Tax=Klebsiella pneumoniae TaxID=573 RepID=A0A378FTK5_KLEPN|nr:YccS/YhfK family integral membrane protein [Klebsiella pneumoniae]
MAGRWLGFTVTAVYTLQLLTLNGEQFIIARLIDHPYRLPDCLRRDGLAVAAVGKAAC